MVACVCGALVGEPQGASVVACVEAYAGEVVDAVGEAVEDDFQSFGTVCGEDVRQEAVGEVGEVCVSKEAFHSFGAYRRVVGDVGEAVLCDVFVCCKHNAIF